MTLDALIILAGAFVILEPQLGFPTSWDAVILLVVGLLIVGLGIAVRRRGLREVNTVNKQAPESGDIPRVQ